MRIGLGLGLSFTAAGVGGPLPVPSGFNWTPPIKISRSSAGVYSTDYDSAPFLVEGDPGVTTFYIDGDTGNDGNAGTAVSPKKSFNPVTGGRYTKLLLKIRGKFYRNTASYIQYAHDNLCVEAWGGASAILTTETDPAYPFVWTSEGSGTWSSPWPAGSINTGNNVYAGTVVDSLARLAPVGTSALCLSTASSQFIDYGASKQWVHTSDGSSPATGHTLYGTNGEAGIFEASANAYPQRIMFVNIQFRGGNTAMHVYGDSAFPKTIEFVGGCSFKHANNFGALHCTGNTVVINHGSTAGPSVFDGFSYSTASGSAGGNVPNSVEISCIGRDNGWQSTGANQGSTTHFTGQAVRVNCQYYSNANDQVADVGAGTRSWNLGCTFGPAGIGSGYAGVQAGNDATDIRMWLDGCTFSGLTYDVNTASGASLFYKNMTAPVVNPASAGTVGTY